MTLLAGPREALMADNSRQVAEVRELREPTWGALKAALATIPPGEEALLGGVKVRRTDEVFCFYVGDLGYGLVEHDAATYLSKQIAILRYGSVGEVRVSL